VADREDRALERAAQDPEERARLLRHRLRAGKLALDRLALAAALGDKAAALAHGEAIAPWQPRRAVGGQRTEWDLERLALGGPRGLARACVAAGLYTFDSQHRVEPKIVRRAYSTSRGLIDRPDRERLAVIGHLREQIHAQSCEQNARDREDDGDESDWASRAARAARGMSGQQAFYEAALQTLDVVREVVSGQGASAGWVLGCLRAVERVVVLRERVEKPIRAHLLAWSVGPVDATTRLAARVWRGDLASGRVCLLARLGHTPSLALCGERGLLSGSHIVEALAKELGGEACVRAALAAGRVLNEPAEKLASVERWLLESAKASDLRAEDWLEQAADTVSRARWATTPEQTRTAVLSELAPWILGEGDPLR
jgi:hypothetical protein